MGKGNMGDCGYATWAVVRVTLSRVGAIWSNPWCNEGVLCERSYGRGCEDRPWSVEESLRGVREFPRGRFV
jgi:hypothetical protein